MFDSGGQSNNRPSYYKPNTNQYHYQNNWNTYESNHIMSNNYPSYQSPLSFNHDYQFNRPQTSIHQPQYGGFVDDSGYAISPSAVVSNDRPTNHNRPQSPPARPTYDYDDDYSNYRPKEGIHTKSFHSSINSTTYCTSKNILNLVQKILTPQFTCSLTNFFALFWNNWKIYFLSVGFSHNLFVSIF